MDRINGADTVDIGGGRRGFRDENLVAGVAGTEVTAAFLNATQEEIVNVIQAAGLTPTNDELQLFLALKWHMSLSAGRLLNVQIFTASGIYQPTAGTTIVVVEGCGGGGAGAGGSNPAVGNVSLGAPGGSASSGRGRYSAADIGGSQNVIIGAGGVGGVATAGTNGGTTQFGALLSYPGGIGGGPLNNVPPPAFNGNGSFSGQAVGANISSKQGATPGYATAISGAAVGMFVGPGGDTPFGNGRPNISNANGLIGLGYGSGGSGVALAAGGGPALGGSGASGILIVSEYGGN